MKCPRRVVGKTREDTTLHEMIAEEVRLKRKTLPEGNGER